MPYAKLRREIECCQFPWGSLCFIRDPLSPIQRTARGRVFVSVGDLLLGGSEPVADGLIHCAADIRDGRAGPGCGLKAYPCFTALNGAFAICVADEKGPAIVTDPLGSVQVYAGRSRNGDVTAVGTHPDLVACLANDTEEIDPTSVFEFINAGTPCFPHTMHKCVHELGPGRLHVLGRGADGRIRVAEAVWWPFPEEIKDIAEEEELAPTLGRAFTDAVQDRCVNGTIGVTLSGGLDSRLVMAAVPKTQRCVGFTFCDVINRESRIARRVARCYRREWVPLFRDPEYIARTALDTIRFIGCEGDWVNAHGMGFVKEMAEYEPGVVLSGLLMNNNVKGYYAADVARIARGGGLLPPRYEIMPYDYVNELKPLGQGVFGDDLLESARSRRKTFLAGHPGLRRQSAAEWLDGYPFSQAPDNTGWVAERRVMPVRLPAMDRRLLEIACRIPMSMKAGGRLFSRMAKGILGRGAWIPDANDGVRPGSNHVWRLLQRALRETANRRRTTLRALGFKQAVPTSWHDYQSYWRQSAILRQLLAEHGKNLRSFEATVFRADPRTLWASPDLNWLHGFRLVQLALWKSVVQEYRTAAKGRQFTRPELELSSPKGSDS